MSSSTQLNLFPLAQSELNETLEIVRGGGIRHRFFKNFVSSLVTSFKANCNGATTIAACPDGVLDQVLEDFATGVATFETRTHRAESHFSFLELRAPSSLSPAQVKAELLDRYRMSLHTAKISHRTQPRFLGEQFDRMGARTDVGQLVEFLRYKRPPLVVLRDAQNFALPGAPMSLARANWRLVMDIAAQSGIPHLICGTMDTVLEVLSDADFHSATDVFFLRPYEISERNKKQRAIFVGILGDFDAVLPWLDRQESLGRRIDVINKCIAGDTDRLRRWVLRAITTAISDGASLLEWSHFEITQPTAKQAAAAHKELTQVAKDFPWVDLSENNEPESQVTAKGKSSRLKPGNRRDGRDHVNTA